MIFRRNVIRLVLLVLTGVSALPAQTAAAQTPVDLVEQLVAKLTTAAGTGEDVFAWDELPQTSQATDETDDLFVVEGGTPSYRPPSADLVQESQFGTTFSDQAFRELFGKDGALDCEAATVSCASYGSRANRFADGAIVVGFQLAGTAEVSGTEALTIAVLANDDDFPTFQDPRPASPFVDTNKAWRLDLSANGDTVSYLQVTGGPFQEFRTDARVLLTGEMGWFFIPPSEFPLASTITGFDVHSFAVPGPDAPAKQQAADTVGSVAPRTLSVPVGPTALMLFAPVTVASPTTSPSQSASPVPDSGDGQAASDSSPNLALLMGLVFLAAVMIYLGAALLIGSWPFPRKEEPTPLPPTVVKEKRTRRVQRRVEHTGTETIIETMEEEYEVEVPVVVRPPEEPKEVSPPEPPEQLEHPPGADVSDILEATPGPGSLAGIGAGVAIAEGMPPETPCLEEYRRWKAAEGLCTSAQQAAELAETAAEEARVELEHLRSEFPPLGFDQSDEPVIVMDDGSRMSELDAGLLGWDRANRPQPPRPKDPRERLEQTKEQLRRLRDELARMKAKEAELATKLAEAEAAARQARAHADEVCAQAAEAKAAWERCVGVSGGAKGGVVAPPGGGEQPKPDQPKPEPPKPEPPKKPETPEPPEAPETPKPPAPRKPEPPKPAPPKPGGGAGGGETPSGGCKEGETRETDVTTLVLEVPRRGGRATITITQEAGGAVEFEGHPAQVFLDARQWAQPIPATMRGGSSLYRLDITLQMERISARCYRVERCFGGRWVASSGRTREVADPDPFEKKLVHAEELDGEALRRALNRARGTFMTADASREKLDSFCE